MAAAGGGGMAAVVWRRLGGVGLFHGGHGFFL